MKKIHLFGALLVFFSVFPVKTEAQAKQKALVIPVNVSYGNLGDYGFESPYTSAGVGLEARSQHIFLQLGGEYSPTAKLGVGNGSSLLVNGSLLAKFGPVFAGAGARQSSTRNSDYKKTVLRPTLNLGIETGNFRFLLERELKSKDDPNSLEGWILTGRLRISAHTRVGAQVLSSNFNDSAGRKQGATALLLSFEYLFYK